MSLKQAGRVLLIGALALALAAPAALAAQPIKIAQVVGVTGPLEAYSKQSITGFKMGWSTPPTAACRSTAAHRGDHQGHQLQPQKANSF